MAREGWWSFGLLRLHISLLGTALLLLACDVEEPPGFPEPKGCNGHEQLCERRLSEVAFACAHNAMSNAEEGWDLPNQNLPVSQQLKDGVRAFMLDLYWNEDKSELLLCHGICELGSQPFAELLELFAVFLQENRGDVLVLILESYVGDEAVEAAFLAAGLGDFLHSQDNEEPWPTLGSMVESGRRLVVMSEGKGGPSAWHHSFYSFAAETHYSYNSPEAMDCAPHRGGDKNQLFLINHFISNPFPDLEAAAVVNAQEFLRERVHTCASERKMFPTFISVDFYDVGGLFQVVDELNSEFSAAHFEQGL